MELDELKQNWAELNQRLRDNEILTESLIKQMVQSKGKSSRDKLIVYDIVGALVLFFSLFFWAYSSNTNNLNDFLINHIKGLIIFSLVGIIYYIVKVVILCKIDFSKSIIQNFTQVNRYKIMLKAEIIIGIAYFMYVFISMIAFLLKMKASPIIFIIEGIVLIITLALVYFITKKLYLKNIKSIIDNLNEIRELDSRD